MKKVEYVEFFKGLSKVHSIEVENTIYINKNYDGGEEKELKSFCIKEFLEINNDKQSRKDVYYGK